MSLVLLHGFTGHATSWDRVASLLPADRRVFRPCLFGHDPALRGVHVERFEDEVDRIAEAVRAERLEGATVAGYSMGGRVALGLLVRHPDLFKAAVVVGANPGLADEAARRERIAWEERWAAALERDGIEAFVAAWERLPLFATQRRLSDAVHETHRARRLAHDPRGLAAALRVLGLGRMPLLLPELARVRIPVRLVVGALDGKLVGLARAMAERLSHAEVRLVEDAGHDLLLERPRAVAAALTEGTTE